MPKPNTRLMTGLKHDERGATAVEYGLLLALMVLALIGALAATGSATEDNWNGVANKVETAMQDAGV